MIETAPEVLENEDIIPMMVNLQMNGDLQKIQDDYLYWDKVKYKAKDGDPSELWSAVRLDRRLKSKRITFHKYDFFYVITDYIQKSLHQFDMHTGGSLSSNIGIAETDKTKFILSSIMEEAISSSQLEGANTTRKKAREMIQQEKKPRSKSEQMILNNYDTMKYIVQHKDEDLTIETLLNIHRLITKNTLHNAEDEGRFRTNNNIHVVNNYNGEIAHDPPSNLELEKLINDLCLFFNENRKEFIHPIIKGCIIHFMIGWIHPFTDGNGRTARAIFYWFMLKNGYWLIEYLSISRIIKDTKAQYEKAFLYTEIDKNDVTYFITYHLKTMEKAISALKEYINHKQKEVFQAAEFMKIPNVNDRMAQIIKIINDDPDRILNTKDMKYRFNVSDYSARTDLKSLVELGLLEIIQVNKQKKNYIRSPNFEQVLKSFRG